MEKSFLKELSGFGFNLGNAKNINGARILFSVRSSPLFVAVRKMTVFTFSIQLPSNLDKMSCNGEGIKKDLSWSKNACIFVNDWVRCPMARTI